MPQPIIEHDSWNYSPPKLPKATKIELPSIFGVLPFDGVRNPGFRSATSHRVWFTYRTEANNWQPKIGICESAVEFGVGLEALLDPNTYDISFQPCTVRYYCPEERRNIPYRHDILVTLRNGNKRLLFVRNRESLEKEKTWRNIKHVAEATKIIKFANDMIPVDGDTYTPQRRENLYRMWKISDQPDHESDEEVFSAARRCRALWYMRDLFPLVNVDQKRAFASCYRLIAQKRLEANLDNVLWEHSRVWLPK